MESWPSGEGRSSAVGGGGIIFNEGGDGVVESLLLEWPKDRSLKSWAAIEEEEEENERVKKSMDGWTSSS